MGFPPIWLFSKDERDMTLQRLSSRLERLDRAFLAKSLDSASKHLRIAGNYRAGSSFALGNSLVRNNA